MLPFKVTDKKYTLVAKILEVNIKKKTNAANN